VYFVRQKNSLLSGLHFLATRDILNTDDIQEFLDWFELKIRKKRTEDEVKHKIIKWFNKKKQGLKDYFKKNIKNDSAEFYKKVERVLHEPSDSPEWLTEKLKEDPHYLSRNEVYKIRAPLKSDTKLVTKLDHIVDYLIYYLKNNKGKALDSVTWTHVKRGIEKWEKSFALKKEIKEVLPGEKLVLKSSDGFSWYELTDSLSLANEGSRMDHCVGGACSAVISGGTKIFSLRDQDNLPHATLEYDVPDHSFNQLKGKNNSAISKKYSKYLKEFLENFKQENPDTEFSIEANDFEASGIYEYKGQLADVHELIPFDHELVDPKSLNDKDLKRAVTSFPRAIIHSRDLATVRSVLGLDRSQLVYVTHLSYEDARLIIRDQPIFYKYLNPKYKTDPETLEMAETFMKETRRYAFMYDAFPKSYRDDPDNWEPILEEDTAYSSIVSHISPDVKERYMSTFLRLLEDVRKTSLFFKMTPEHIDSLYSNEDFVEYLENKELLSGYPDDLTVPQVLHTQARPERLSQWKQAIKDNNGFISKNGFNVARLPLKHAELRDNKDAKILTKELFPILSNKIMEDAKFLRTIHTESTNYVLGTSYIQTLGSVFMEAVKPGTDIFNRLETGILNGELSYFDIPVEVSRRWPVGAMHEAIEKEMLGYTDLFEDTEDFMFSKNIKSLLENSSKIRNHIVSLLNEDNVKRFIDSRGSDSLPRNISAVIYNSSKARDLCVEYLKNNFNGVYWRQYQRDEMFVHFRDFPAEEVELRALQDDFKGSYRYVNVPSYINNDFVKQGMDKIILQSESIESLFENIHHSLYSPKVLREVEGIEDSFSALFLEASPYELNDYSDRIGNIFGDVVASDPKIAVQLKKSVIHNKVVYPEAILEMLDDDYRVWIIEALTKDFDRFNEYFREYGVVREAGEFKLFILALKNNYDNIKYLPVYETNRFNTNIYNAHGLIEVDPEIDSILYKRFKEIKPGEPDTPMSFYYVLDLFEKQPDFYEVVIDYYSSANADFSGLSYFLSKLKNPLKILIGLRAKGGNLYKLFTLKLGDPEDLLEYPNSEEFLVAYSEDYKEIVDDYLEQKGTRLLTPFRFSLKYTEPTFIESYKNRILKVKDSGNLWTEKPSIVLSILGDADIQEFLLEDIVNRIKVRRISRKNAEVLFSFPVYQESVISYIKSSDPKDRWRRFGQELVLELVKLSPEIANLLYLDLQNPDLNLVRTTSNAGETVYFRYREEIYELFSKDPFNSLLKKEEFGPLVNIVNPEVEINSSLLKKLAGLHDVL